MDEFKLLDKLRKIETLWRRAGTPGEAKAAAEARERILARLRELREARANVEREHRFTLPDPYTRRLFFALLAKHGLRPYRRPHQRYTTVRVRASDRFVDETLWPEFQRLSARLRDRLTELTDREIRWMEASEVREGAA